MFQKLNKMVTRNIVSNYEDTNECKCKFQILIPGKTNKEDWRSFLLKKKETTETLLQVLLRKPWLC